MKRRSMFSALFSALGFVVAISSKPVVAAATKPYDTPNPMGNPDHEAWTAHFIEHVRRDPSIAFHPGAMDAWFACAIVTGRDTSSAWRFGKSVKDEALRGAIARGWCSIQNSRKEMDLQLAEAILQELRAL